MTSIHARSIELGGGRSLAVLRVGDDYVLAVGFTSTLDAAASLRTGIWFPVEAAPQLIALLTKLQAAE